MAISAPIGQGWPKRSGSIGDSRSCRRRCGATSSPRTRATPRGTRHPPAAYGTCAACAPTQPVSHGTVRQAAELCCPKLVMDLVWKSAASSWGTCLTMCCGAAAKRLAVHEVPTLLPAWVPDGFAAFNPYGMGRHQARAPAAVWQRLQTHQISTHSCAHGQAPQQQSAWYTHIAGPLEPLMAGAAAAARWCASPTWRMSCTAWGSGRGWRAGASTRTCATSPAAPTAQSTAACGGERCAAVLTLPTVAAEALVCRSGLTRAGAATGGVPTVPEQSLHRLPAWCGALWRLVLSTTSDALARRITCAGERGAGGGSAAAGAPLGGDRGAVHQPLPPRQPPAHRPPHQHQRLARRRAGGPPPAL